MGENHHPSLKYSLVKSSCSIYFKLKGYVVQGSGCTLPKFCVDWSKTVVLIKVLVEYFFRVNLYLVHYHHTLIWIQ